MYQTDATYGRLFKQPLRIKLTGDDEIGCLIKTNNTFGAFRFTKTDSCFAEHVLYGGFHHIPNQFRYRISMPSKRTAKKSFIEQHGIWHTKFCHGAYSTQPCFRIRFVQAMNFLCINGRRPLRQELTSYLEKRALILSRVILLVLKGFVGYIRI